MPQDTPQFDEKMAIAMFSHALGKLDPNRVTKQELEDFIKAMKQFAENIKTMTEQNLRQIMDSVSKAHENLSGKVDSLSSTNKQEIIALVEKTMNSMMLTHEAMMAEADAKMDSMSETMDAHDQEMMDKMMAMIPTMPELKPDTAIETRDKLETLEGDERLDISAIKDLEEKLKALKKSIDGKIMMVGGGSSGGGHIVKSYDLSASLNGVLTTFSLPAFWRVISVHLSSLPVLRETTDWTQDAGASTISFTSQVNAGTDLSAGQSLYVIYSE